MKIASFYALLLTILTTALTFSTLINVKNTYLDKVTIQFYSIIIETGDHSCNDEVC